MTMSEQEKLFDWRSQRGETFYADGKAVTPVSRALTLRFGHWGAAVWNRPIYLEIDDNSQISREQIPNLTLIGQLVSLAAAIIIGMITWLIVKIYRTW